MKKYKAAGRQNNFKIRTLLCHSSREGPRGSLFQNLAAVYWFNKVDPENQVDLITLPFRIVGDVELLGVGVGHSLTLYN